jgi:hypothetical protein
MQKAHVHIGGTYSAKVSGKLTTIRIDAEKPNGGWSATNLATGKTVQIKSARRLRRPTGPDGTVVANKPKTGKTTTPAKAVRTGDAPRSQLDLEETTKLEAARAKKAKAKADGQAKKLSAINAAAQVLAESKRPMTSRELIETMAAKKLWTSPGGQTPHATLYAAILREINTKGKDARFKKAERGKFAVTR